MLQLFRNFFKSKVGIVVTLGFLGLIAFAFASSDVANNLSSGGVTGSDRIALVGDRSIDTTDLSVRANDALTRIRQENPTMTMEGFIANNGLQGTLEAMISRAAIAEVGQKYGLRAGTRLVDSEIYNIPSLRSADGTLDEDTFRNALRQQGISEALFRDDLAMGLFSRQLVQPATLSVRMPETLLRRYSELRLETRNGSIASLMASTFAPQGDPTAEQLQAFYDENSDNYIRPERRVIRYATFGEEAFAELPEPTQEQIAERYERDELLYSEREMRGFTQLIATTQAAAQAIVDEVNGGVALETSARNKGLSTSAIGLATFEDFSSATSNAVATAGFTTEQGDISAPAQGQLGWYIIRVDQVDKQESRSINQARAEISAALTIEQRRIALNDTTAEIEDEFARGRSLSEMAEQLGLEVQTTRPLTAVGQIYGTQEGAAPELLPILPVAFEMEEGEPQLAEAVPGQVFIVFDVADITSSAVAPFAELGDDLVGAWRADEGMKAAGEATTRVLERIEAGSTFAQALREEDVSIPSPEAIRLNREAVERNGRVARPIALFFSMTEGTVKPLESAESGGWFIVSLDEITSPEIEENSQVLLATNAQLLPLLADEYTEQFLHAVERDVDIDINQDAVDAVAALLTGNTN